MKPYTYIAPPPLNPNISIGGIHLNKICQVFSTLSLTTQLSVCVSAKLRSQAKEGTEKIKETEAPPPPQT